MASCYKSFIPRISELNVRLLNRGINITEHMYVVSLKKIKYALNTLAKSDFDVNYFTL